MNTKISLAILAVIIAIVVIVVAVTSKKSNMTDEAPFTSGTINETDEMTTETTPETTFTTQETTFEQSAEVDSAQPQDPAFPTTGFEPSN